MGTTEHMPGPRKAFKETFEKITISGMDPSGDLRIVATCQGDPGIVEANAGLIAAAPVMLKTLSRIEASLTVGSMEEHAIREVALKDVRTAITLAKSCF